MNKIMNLKKAQELHNKMFAAYQEKYSDCNRNFTGNLSQDVEIQKKNIEEGQAVYLKMQEIYAEMTKNAMKDQDGFEKAIKDAEAFIAQIQ